MRAGSIVSTLKNVWSSIPFSARIGVAISDTLSIVNARPMGEQKWTSDASRRPRLPQLGLDQEGDLERRRRALVGHPGDADHDPAAGERVERRAEPQRGVDTVEVVGLLVEVRDLLGHGSAQPVADEEVVIADRVAGLEEDRARRRVDAGRAGDDELDPAVQQGSLGAVQVLRLLAAHRHVHEAGLVDVLAALVDQGQLHVAVADPASQATGEEVRGQGPPDPAAQDHDPLHHAPTAASRRRSRRSRRASRRR